MKSKSEEFCRESFDKFLRRVIPTSTIFWQDVKQKDEPPDFYLFVNSMKYAVDVTQLLQQVDVGTKKPLPFGKVRDWLREFIVDDVEAVAKANSVLHGSYQVSFTKPITDFAINKALIQSELLSYIFNTQAKSKAPPKTVYKRNRQECLIEKMNNDENKVVMGGPTIGGWLREESVEVKQLLDNRLDEKHNKLRNIADPKILLLHDKYYLADLDAYKACISKASSLQSFHTIFIVGCGYEGQILYSRDATWTQSL